MKHYLEKKQKNLAWAEENGNDLQVKHNVNLINKVTTVINDLENEN